MTSIMAQSREPVLEPSAVAVRKLFRASARALMANRPLREVARPAGEPSAMLSRPELRALEETGLSTLPWVGAAAHDPLTDTIVHYMALIETSLSTAQAAALLGVDVSRIRQRIRNRSLAGVEYEGEWRLPRFQFERNLPKAPCWPASTSPGGHMQRAGMSSVATGPRMPVSTTTCRSGMGRPGCSRVRCSTAPAMP